MNERKIFKDAGLLVFMKFTQNMILVLVLVLVLAL